MYHRKDQNLLFPVGEAVVMRAGESQRCHFNTTYVTQNPGLMDRPLGPHAVSLAGTLDRSELERGLPSRGGAGLPRTMARLSEGTRRDPSPGWSGDTAD